jgi:formylmethanofuran dehydrogenase subunit E
MRPFEELLEESVAAHGHLCAGQVIGVRMAMLGCQLIGIPDPHADEWRKKIMVYIEIDRCATDAIGSVTGCKLGKRTMKFRDYGINAATFVNLETDKAVRIVSTESSRHRAVVYAPEEINENRQQLIGYMRMPDEVLFDIQEVSVDIPEWEMAGPARRKVVCTRCGQVVRDGREVCIGEDFLCRPCAGDAYFLPIAPQQQFRARCYASKVEG